MHDTPTEEFIGSIGYTIGIILFLLLFVALYFAMEKDFKNHKRVIHFMFFLQTGAIFWMIFSLLFTFYGKHYGLHALVGSFAYLLIAYNILLMDRKIPRDFRIPHKYEKPLMQFTWIVWGLIIMYGLFLYLTVT